MSTLYQLQLINSEWLEFCVKKKSEAEFRLKKNESIVNFCHRYEQVEW